MEDLNENIKTLQEKIDNNATRIIENMNKLHSHEEMINSNSNKIQENSFALEILKDIKKDSQELSKANKRVYVVLTIIIILWVITIGYLVYVLNDVGTIETTTQEVQQESTNGNNNYIGNDGDITNGEANN